MLAPWFICCISFRIVNIHLLRNHRYEKVCPMYQYHVRFSPVRIHGFFTGCGQPQLPSSYCLWCLYGKLQRQRTRTKLYLYRQPILFVYGLVLQCCRRYLYRRTSQLHLQLDLQGIQFSSLGPSLLKNEEGNWVLAIGNPAPPAPSEMKLAEADLKQRLRGAL